MSRLEKNALEWAVFTLGLFAVLATVGYLIYDAATGDDSPPDLRVEIGRPLDLSGVFAVPVTVYNRGGETAAGVTVEVVLEVPGSPPERAGFDVAFVPRQSRREGWVTFRQDPRKGRLTGRAAGYENP